jgi:hypothetical protein
MPARVLGAYSKQFLRLPSTDRHFFALLHLFVAGLGPPSHMLIAQRCGIGPVPPGFFDMLDDKETMPPRRIIKMLGREMTMPRSRRARIGIGIGLTVLGLFGFLPILGFWMIPLGILILSYEYAVVRRARRRTALWWGRRRGRRRTRDIHPSSPGLEPHVKQRLWRPKRSANRSPR